MTEVYFVQDTIKRMIEKEEWGVKAIYWPEYKNFVSTSKVTKYWLGFIPYEEEVEDFRLDVKDMKWRTSHWTSENLLWKTSTDFTVFSCAFDTGKEKIVLFR